MAILVTGGTGYIGSHTVVELLNDGKEVVILDNLNNSNKLVLEKIAIITNGKNAIFYEGDVLNYQLLRRIFTSHTIESVIHFAGLKAVGESVFIPLKYYLNNVQGTLTLCNVMAESEVKNLIFSSSATVYGEPSKLPIKEDSPTSALNPYGRSKLMIENVLADLYQADECWNIAILRYFNPVGAHETGLIGEDPNDVPNNLLPLISLVAAGKRDVLYVFGDDYPTHDGTGLRDYIHVVDLAIGHLKSIEKLKTKCGLVTYNLGTGTGYSVFDLIRAFEKSSGRPINYRIIERRLGDVAACYADPSHAMNELGWKATYSIDDMVRSSWKWQVNSLD